MPSGRSRGPTPRPGRHDRGSRRRSVPPSGERLASVRRDGPRRAFEPAAGRDPVVDHPGPGSRPAPGPAAVAPRSDGRLGLRVLPRSARGDGLRPVHRATERHRRPGERRRAPLELRLVRLARANPRVRLERLRRDPARAMGVGRQAPRRQRRHRLPDERVHPRRGADGDAGHRAGIPRADGSLLGDAPPRHLVRPDDRGGHRDAARRDGQGRRRQRVQPEGRPGAPQPASSPRRVARTG